MKRVLLLVGLLFVSVIGFAQETEEELKALLGPKKDSIAAIQGRVDAFKLK